ncbi:UNVERIFIED_ORG: hypothetical protein J2W85_007035 [Ensifer adhaerens]|nr:hypothetical protein [Ensifer adhaerens]
MVDIEGICLLPQIAQLVKAVGSRIEVDARFASCVPMAPSGTHPSSLSIWEITFLMTGVASFGCCNGVGA